MKKIILLIVLALEGLGGIFGGILLTIAPDGHLMDMPIEIMHGVFANFFIPGLILTGMGTVTLVAFVALFLKSKTSWFLTGVALIGFTIWFIVEIAILRQVLWIHIVSGIPVLIGIWAALPLILNKINNVFLLRIIHTIFAVYFIGCIAYIYFCAITIRINLLLFVNIFSIVLEGFLVFILNHGHCPLAPLQRKLNDPVPFFNLFLPDYLAKKAIPFFSLTAILGILLLIVRILVNR